MLYSISAHFGTKMSRDHNIRNPKVVNSEKHIDPKGYHETIQDSTVRQAYAKIFGQAQLNYNSKQTRSDRLIHDYFTKVLEAYKRDPKRNSATSQEVIFTIGNINNCPDMITSRNILVDFLEKWKKENPNIYVFGVYFHADEPGSAPHLHVDYILVKRKNKRGMALQVGQEGALKEMGYYTTGTVKEGDRVTAQTKWQRATRELLRSVARTHGLEIENEGSSKGSAKHLDTEIFKKQTELRKIEDTIFEKQMWAENAKNEAINERNKLMTLKTENKELETWIKVKKASLEENNELKSKVKELEKEVSFLKKSINVLQRAFDYTKKLLKGYFIQDDAERISMWDKFKQSFEKEKGKEEYRGFEEVRNNPHINEVLLQHEMDYLDGTRQDAPRHLKKQLQEKGESQEDYFLFDNR